MHIRTDTRDPVAELYNHKVWKEVQAMIRMKTANAVTIYSSWFEELNKEDRLSELLYSRRYTEIIQKNPTHDSKFELSSAGSISQSSGSCSSSSSCSSSCYDSSSSDSSLFQNSEFSARAISESDFLSSDSECSGMSDFSKYTLNNYLKNGIKYYTVNLMIQMDFCNADTLQGYLNDRNIKTGNGFVSKSTGVIDREYNNKIFKQMVNGLAQVHKKQVVHRDLKPENIFMNQDKNKSLPVAKIGDFGLAILPGEEHEVAGTQDYMAPEVKSHFNNGTQPKTQDIVTLQKQDIYQLGLILYELSHKIKTNM